MHDHESGDVGQTDQPRERDGAKDHEQRGPPCAHTRFTQVGDDGRPAAIGGRKLVAQCRLDPQQILPSLLERDAWLQARDPGHESGLTLLQQ